MAVVATLDRQDVAAVDQRLGAGLGGLAYRTGSLAFDDSALEAGEPLTPEQLGFTEIVFIKFESTGGYKFSYDRTLEAVIAWHGNWDAVADGPFVPTPDATNLATLTAVPFFAVGVPYDEGT